MSEQSPEQGAVRGEITDEQLPEDVRRAEDNPLAEPLDPDDEETKSRDELGMRDTQDGTPDENAQESAQESAQQSDQESAQES